jgi:hypothetical protein
MRSFELRSADGRRWLVAGLSRSGPSAPVSSLDSLAQSGCGAILFLEEHLFSDLEPSPDALWQDVPEGESFFMVLLRRGDPPRVDPHYGQPIASFLCSPRVFADFFARHPSCWPESFLYGILRSIADGTIVVDRLLVRQLPANAAPAARPCGVPKAVIVPHRGDPLHLRVALRYLSRARGNGLSIRVGLDVDEPTAYGELICEHRAVAFFGSEPAPLGPYVIRQELAERSGEPLLALQDSDDLSCYDRFDVLGSALAENGCALVGSHELCLDEIRGLVQPVRYPLDASGALAICPNHALLHGTLMARRSAFLECGGLSTHLSIANDTQFLLRAWFSMKIRNVDEFLYVRRRHAASLTNAPETVHDNPLRRSLNARWTADFEAIKRGELKLEASSLRPARRSEPYRLEPLVAQASWPAQHRPGGRCH